MLYRWKNTGFTEPKVLNIVFKYSIWQPLICVPENTHGPPSLKKPSMATSHLSLASTWVSLSKACVLHSICQDKYFTYTWKISESLSNTLIISYCVHKWIVWTKLGTPTWRKILGSALSPSGEGMCNPICKFLVYYWVLCYIQNYLQLKNESCIYLISKF